ncbi:SURF1 family protein [Roseomonas sp. M0104]|uniref:SURF1-like protein n=1 Tax=Teichococcus coralli TaxID=2545983 RepID=A0A845BID3_9PROT|nr:SURF1 family protein [Pseudoroseomonas coralli]MXP65047.1 SURF1 family protein [Pseudoroseomonas coralli]
MPAPGPAAAAEEAGRPRSPRLLALLGALAVLGVIILVALGNWQVARRAWKLDLIARVDARVHAAPVPPPAPPEWPQVSAARDEYRHVRAAGRYLPGNSTLVQASTVLGAGYWVLTPFRTQGGFTVLINRGFVPGDREEATGHLGATPAGTVAVTGLLRLGEPGGAFLRGNVPAEGRWYSRDVAAIAANQGLGEVAPYFIDAEAGPDPRAYPVGGLTVISFPNNHLVYAITWYALALMLAGTTFYAAREEWRIRRGKRP